MCSDRCIEEKPSGDRAITGVPTSVTAFVGATRLGRSNEPAHCLNFEDYETQFGGLHEPSDVSYAVHQFFANGGTDAIVVRTAEEPRLHAQSVLDSMHALDREDLFSVLCLPGVGEPAVLKEAATFCSERRAFFIADLPASIMTPDDVMGLIDAGALPESDQAAVYYPWVHVDDPLNEGRLRRVPPSGTVAGLYARVDGSEGVWKSPAGSAFPLAGISGPVYPLRDDENSSLNSRGINCIRTFRASGTFLWGARTLAGSDVWSSEWKYIAVRRTAPYIEESLSRGLHWAVLEPNGAPLWKEIRQHVDSFLLAMFRQNAFRGTTPQEAYFVKCGVDTMTQSDVNRGIVNVSVGFAAIKPAEFVVIRLQQPAGATGP